MLSKGLRDKCNLDFKKVVVYAKRKDERNFKKYLIAVMEELLEISSQSLQREYYENKIIFLLSIIHKVNNNGLTNDIVYKLTGEEYNFINNDQTDNTKSDDSSKMDNYNQNMFDLDNISKTSLISNINKQKQQLDEISENIDLNIQDDSKNIDEMDKKEIQNNINIPISEFEHEQENILSNLHNDQKRVNIRPLKLEDFLGQQNLKQNLSEALQVARKKHEPLDHVLLYGPAGLGKTTIARIIANEMNSNIIILNASTINTVNDLIKQMVKLKENDVLFIDEVHRLKPQIAESIYMAMEDFILYYIDKKGESCELLLPQFTLIGATTDSGMLTKPMRDRFLIQLKLELYTEEELSLIAQTTFEKYGFKNVDIDVCNNIASRSRGTPRICNTFVKRISDKAIVHDLDVIDNVLANQYFKDNRIYYNGLTETDVNFLNIIINKFDGGPVGIENLALALGENKNIIENQYEPYLIFMGLLKITSKGRVVTENAYKMLDDINKQNETI